MNNDLYFNNQRIHQESVIVFLLTMVKIIISKYIFHSFSLFSQRTVAIFFNIIMLGQTN